MMNGKKRKTSEWEAQDKDTIKILKNNWSKTKTTENKYDRTVYYHYQNKYKLKCQARLRLTYESDDGELTNVDRTRTYLRLW